ncbi:MAG: twin-arginine translocase TatA/TatE family subunit [Planctomyces sp.]|nr:twin-arginine translocase TatA/TatE family subunit [Planctomyces sp.]
MPFGLGPAEVIIVLAIVVLIFGAHRLPVLGSSMGKAIRSFHQGVIGAGDAATTDRDE